MKLTIQSLRDFDPCYDLTEFFPEDWEGTLLEALEDERIPAADRIWVFCEAQTKDIQGEFARWCALQVIHLWDAPEVVKEFLETGDESKREAARSAVRAAATWAATWNATGDAAWAATWNATGAATWAATWNAPGAAVRARAAGNDEASQLKKAIELTK